MRGNESVERFINNTEIPKEKRDLMQQLQNSIDYEDNRSNLLIAGLISYQTQLFREEEKRTREVK